MGEQVTRFEKGDRVTTHFIRDWEKGPFEQDYLGETYLATSLGIPGPGTLTEYISLSERARVIVLSSSDDKLAWAKKLGADATINYRKNPVWWKEVRELCGGHGVDHVVEVGGPGTFDQSIKALKSGGFIAVVGLLGGTETTIDQLTFIVRNARVESLTVGSRESFEKMNEFLVANELHPIVGAVFPWSKAAEAFRELEAGKHFGKIVLRRE